MMLNKNVRISSAMLIDYFIIELLNYYAYLTHFTAVNGEAYLNY